MQRPQGSWRDTGREAKLWIFNASATFPILFFLFSPSIATAALVAVTIVVLMLLDYYGFKPIVFLRLVKSMLAGRVKPARPWWLR
ncbi:IcmT/TraK family protein [Candidatus Comchoanobacter bicostacola]|uniref:IcmT/TraK family protein n=1 Tax=Candidatus Comchoanobacter bicostacola TaxID=2919598 RepID=A0ABY5DL53_9GAMM|nr:IcmT/TraK family protein [Candidatus Comchoanobacter bicostacola]UTC24409.1 IcmT/TraK family protein [Candidatus Comchoanobacter bicostacola]